MISFLLRGKITQNNSWFKWFHEIDVAEDLKTKFKTRIEKLIPVDDNVIVSNF